MTTTALERTIEKYLRHEVEAAGGQCYKWTSPGRRGVPDRIVVMPGMVAFVELKRLGKKATPQQTREHARLSKLGCKVYVIDTHQGVDLFMANYTYWKKRGLKVTTDDYAPTEHNDCQ